jgi:hypothetical protein
LTYAGTDGLENASREFTYPMVADDHGPGPPVLGWRR